MTDKPRTWFERRHRERMKDTTFAKAYAEAKAEIDEELEAGSRESGARSWEEE